MVLILGFFPQLCSPDVEFCGYTIPHPSESKMNIRIQTYGVFSLLTLFFFARAVKGVGVVDWNPPG